MVSYEDDCCGCDSDLYPCIGDACKLKKYQRSKEK